MSKQEKVERYKAIFWDAFHVPKLKSEKIEKVYLELEQLNSILAGPLFSIYEKGSCDFIFSDDHRFPTINNNDDLFERNVAIIAHYRERIEGLEIETPNEAEDVKVLLYQVDLKMELVDLAFAILSD